TIGTACGVGLLAYCAYFDYQRRHAPDYRERVTARRERIRRAREEDDVELPPEHDKEAIEKFFVKEIEVGEECLQAGEVDKAVKHFSYAVIFCPQPQNLLKYMRECLPSTAYTKLVENLSAANKRVAETYNRIHVSEEDVE
ncbi:mitochondrial import receptor subunit TOM20 homolog, partial [Olea europaea subsp. europaea]